MPTYQYACTACEHELEAVQKFTDDALTDCPQCTGRLRKVFSAVGVVFKGSGFYRNDSRAKNGSGETKSGPSDSSGKGENKSESKSEKKAEGKSENASVATGSSGAKSESSSSSSSGSPGKPAAGGTSSGGSSAA